MYTFTNVTNKLTFMQAALFLALAPIFYLFNTSSVLIGWGAVFIANNGAFYFGTMQKPGAVALLSSEVFKYVVFCTLIYLSVKLQPEAWPTAVYGVIIGQFCYLAMMLVLGGRDGN